MQGQRLHALEVGLVEDRKGEEKIEKKEKKKKAMFNDGCVENADSSSSKGIIIHPRFLSQISISLIQQILSVPVKQLPVLNFLQIQ